MSALRESRFRGTAQVTVPDGAAGDAAIPRRRAARPDSPAPACDSAAPAPAPAARHLTAPSRPSMRRSQSSTTRSPPSGPSRRARNRPASACEGGELRWAAADESGALRLDASSFRLVRGGASPTSFAGSLQTPQRHAAGAREWRLHTWNLTRK